jgi:hypothetical protein
VLEAQAARQCGDREQLACGRARTHDGFEQDVAVGEQRARVDRERVPLLEVVGLVVVDEAAVEDREPLGQFRVVERFGARRDERPEQDTCPATVGLTRPDRWDEACPVRSSPLPLPPLVR